MIKEFLIKLEEQLQEIVRQGLIVKNIRVDPNFIDFKIEVETAPAKFVAIKE